MRRRRRRVRFVIVFDGWVIPRPCQPTPMTRCYDTCCRPEPEIKVRVLNVRFPVARKRHECRQCHEPIAVGERHIVEVALIDGEFSERRVHATRDCEGWWL